MALASTIVFEVRTTGNDTNGGGFKTGATGTDWSQQNAAQYSVTDAVTAGTTTITSATANFGTDVVGNVLYIAGGTAPITAGWYEITSRTNSTTIVVDRSTGLSVGTGATLKIGGAFATPGIAASVATVGGQYVWIKAGTYSITSTTSNIAGGRVTQATRTIFRGYSATRGDDGTKPVLQASGIATTTLFTVGTSGTAWNIELDGASLTAIKGFDSSSAVDGANIILCTARNCTNVGFAGGGTVRHYACYATGCSTQYAFTGASFLWCVAEDNTGGGFNTNPNTPLSTFGCLAYGNTGIGFLIGATNGAVNCIAYGNSSDGFDQNVIPTRNYAINCISVSNGGYGFDYGGGTVTPGMHINCATYNNTSGAINGTLTLSTAAIALSGDPFVDSANDNFALNNTAGAGALLRALAFPTTLPDGTLNYLDIGAAQHQDAGGGNVFNVME